MNTLVAFVPNPININNPTTRGQQASGPFMDTAVPEATPLKPHTRPRPKPRPVNDIIVWFTEVEIMTDIQKTVMTE